MIRGDSGTGNKPNRVYDATGCNTLYSAVNTSMKYYGGSHNTTGAVATEGTTKVTVTGGAEFTTVYGGGMQGTTDKYPSTYVEFRGGYLNGIPTVVAGDGNGHAYIYQAKTKDGTLDVYQKDENGKRISNIVRDQVTGHIKVTLDGEKVTTVTQFKNRAFERDNADYIALDASYSALVEEVSEKRNSLTVVADNASAPYGTPYIWSSYVNYFDGEFEELSKRYYSGTMTLDMLEGYTDKLEALAEFIDDSTT